MFGHLRQKFAYSILLISFLIFISLSIGLELKLGFLHRLDLNNFNWWMHHFGEPQMNFSSGFLTGYFTFFAKYFDVLTVVVFTLITAAYYIYKKYYAFSIWLMGVVASGGLVGILLKKLFHRQRPYDHLLQDTGFSFPSGHSLSSTLFFLIAIIILIPRLKNKGMAFAMNSIAFIMWMSILLSRMYFHAHFLTDVVGGVTFSLFWMMLCIELYHRYFVPIVGKYFKDAKVLALYEEERYEQ